MWVVCRYRYPDTAAKLWIFSSVFWFVVVTTFGMIIAIELANPEVFGGIGPLVFSRVRPCHVEGVIFAWLSMMYWAFILFMSPRLLGTPQHVERAAELLERLGLERGHGSRLLRHPHRVTPRAASTPSSSGRSTSPSSSSSSANIVNMIKTVQIRKVRPLYVSIWWAIGAPIWVSASIFIENVVWKPGQHLEQPVGRPGHRHPRRDDQLVGQPQPLRAVAHADPDRGRLLLRAADDATRRSTATRCR